MQTTPAPTVEKMGVEESVQPQPGLPPLFSFAATSLLCCWLSVCPSVSLSVCLSVCSRPGFYLHSLQHIHIHDGSRSLHVEMCARARVCVCGCACMQDLIGLRSEGILRTESQVERRSRDPTVLSIMHFPLFLAPPPPPPPPCAHQRSCGDGTRRLFIRVNSV